MVGAGTKVVMSVDESWRVARMPLPARLVGKAMALGYRIAGLHRYDDFRFERVHGAPFLVIPSVFNPKLTRAGEFFAAQIDSRLVHRDAVVLDMGTGSGVCAVFAARYARRVVAVDINPAATRCAAINALLNDLEHKIDVRHGDLFAPVHGERFDLVMFNPPFLREAPRDHRDRAWRSSDAAERFAAGLAEHLKPGGAALVLLSTFGDCGTFLSEFHNHGFEIAVHAERRFVNERLTLFRLVPATRLVPAPRLVPAAGSPA
jgi:release factor glutamine methyltransferase